MPVWIRSYIKFLIAVCLVISFCLMEGEAQTRKKRRTRRATKPRCQACDYKSANRASRSASGETTAEPAT